MVHRGIDSFNNKHIVLLQGPVGPFFKNLALDLQDIGATVHKINFNGGDWFFSSKDAVNFSGKKEEWKKFFDNFIEKNKIDTLILFGDCREYHRIAHAISDKKGIDIGVFEEGYIRPDYITFEEFGVNGHSLLSRDPHFYELLRQDQFAVPKTIPLGNTFWYAVRWAMLYYIYSALLFPFFRHYKHHRALNLWEGVYWIRSIWRKNWYKLKEFRIQKNMTTQHSKKYFLAPLQITTDAQVVKHSCFTSIGHFIENIIDSFSAHAPKDTLLVIKHHPLDRGYHDYCGLITRLAIHHGVSSRVKYIHDQNLPALLEHALGVVVINSTVGLSAIHHNTPLKVCGTAIYDFKGLTYQQTLDQFWIDAKSFEPNRELYHRFSGYVIKHKQVNGNFYRKIKNSTLKSGVLW